MFLLLITAAFVVASRFNETFSAADLQLGHHGLLGISGVVYFPHENSESESVRHVHIEAGAICCFGGNSQLLLG